MSAWDGSVPFDLGGESVTLRYDWRALSRLREEFGERFGDTISDALAKQDVEKIAVIMALGCGKSKVEVMKASPALVPSIAAVNQALMWAYYGPEDPEPAKKQKGPLASLLARSKGLFTRP